MERKGTFKKIRVNVYYKNKIQTIEHFLEMHYQKIQCWAQQNIFKVTCRDAVQPAVSRMYLFNFVHQVKFKGLRLIELNMQKRLRGQVWWQCTEKKHSL